MDGEKIDKLILKLPPSKKKKAVKRLRALIAEKRFHPDGQKILKGYAEWIENSIKKKKRKGKG